MRMAHGEAEYLVLANRADPGLSVHIHILQRKALFGPDTACDLCSHADLRLASLAARGKGQSVSTGIDDEDAWTVDVGAGVYSGYIRLGLVDEELYGCRCSVC